MGACNKLKLSNINNRLRQRQLLNRRSRTEWPKRKRLYIFYCFIHIYINLYINIIYNEVEVDLCSNVSVRLYGAKM